MTGPAPARVTLSVIAPDHLATAHTAERLGDLVLTEVEVVVAGVAAAARVDLPAEEAAVIGVTDLLSGRLYLVRRAADDLLLAAWDVDRTRQLAAEWAALVAAPVDEELSQ